MPPSTAASASRLCGGTLATADSTLVTRAAGSAADDEHAARGAATADVQRGEALRALDLIVAGAPGHLLPCVEQLTRAGRADRMTGADQAAARVDRPPPVHV